MLFTVTKAKIYNLTLSALMLSEEVEDTDTTKTNEVRVLNTHWDIAFQTTLQDLDLDALSQPVTLELLTTLNRDESPWQYVYKYPNKCVFLRRLDSGFTTDNQYSHIPKRTGIYEGEKAIFTNKYEAIAECITNDIPLSALSPMAAMAVAYKLAYLSAPLITGKGAKALRESIQASYLIFKTEAQETDRIENFNYEDPALRSEFVSERIS